MCCASNLVCVVDTWAYATSSFIPGPFYVCIEAPTPYTVDNPTSSEDVPYGMILNWANGTYLCTIGVSCYFTGSNIVLYSAPAPTSSS